MVQAIGCVLIHSLFQQKMTKSKSEKNNNVVAASTTVGECTVDQNNNSGQAKRVLNLKRIIKHHLLDGLANNNMICGNYISC
uniref:Uncharacterized protein n=1 Tax=Ditylenchus dipsaci TaxID=166011 RepID=A0A915E780_9BILA